MSGMPMPGGWDMSMAWMRMPGQTWAGAGASFLWMWAVMMVPMMLPALVPTLARYRRALEPSRRLAGLTALVAAGYFFVWTALGAVVFPVGAALAAAEMKLPPVARAVPAASGVVLLAAGVLQLTPWKARQLACCREFRGTVATGVAAAWTHGMRLGVQCARCCLALTTVLLVVGVMDLRAMVAVAAAVTLERLAPAGERFARAIGAVVVTAGVLLLVRAAGLA
jgi:predicted metal-binding membrane protein